jgi:hypothetical protein
LELGEDHLCDICREHPRLWELLSIKQTARTLFCRSVCRFLYPEHSLFS